MSNLKTIYYADGDAYTKEDALDVLWWDLSTGEFEVKGISRALRDAAHHEINSLEPADPTPLNMTPDAVRQVIDSIDVIEETDPERHDVLIVVDHGAEAKEPSGPLNAKAATEQEAQNLAERAGYTVKRSEQDYFSDKFIVTVEPIDR